MCARVRAFWRLISFLGGGEFPSSSDPSPLPRPPPLLIAGEVQFIESGGKTTVLFKLEHQLPSLLCDLSIKTFSIEGHLRTIFSENLQEFKKLAEAIARDPKSAEPRKEAELRAPQIGIEEEEEEEVEDLAAGPRGSMEEDDEEEEEEEEDWAGEEDEDEDERASSSSNGRAGPREAAPAPAAAAAAAAPAPAVAAPKAAPKRAGRAASSSGVSADAPAKAPGVRGRRKRDPSAGAQVPTA
jgi:hypothetical protein